jgi:hypothetical protein
MNLPAPPPGRDPNEVEPKDEVVIPFERAPWWLAAGIAVIVLGSIVSFIWLAAKLVPEPKPAAPNLAQEVAYAVDKGCIGIYNTDDPKMQRRYMNTEHGLTSSNVTVLTGSSGPIRVLYVYEACAAPPGQET